MYFNGGDHEDYIFGLCRLTDVDEKNMGEQCSIYYTHMDTVLNNVTTTGLNSG
jgi:hypothetical protein